MTDTTTITTNRPAPRRATDRAQYARTRVGNNAELLPGVDKRSFWVRRAKEIIGDYISDLGGFENTSAAERSLVRRASVLTVELERLEMRFAMAEANGSEASNGEASNGDLDLYVRGVGGLRRLLESVGLQRRAKDVGLSLGELIKADQEEQRLARVREREQQEMPA